MKKVVNKMLTDCQFKILNELIKSDDKNITQRDLVKKIGISLGKINSHIEELKSAGLIQYNSGLTITEKGISALEPYKVDNAIIMAAGMSTRFAPLSYEKPKALLNVRGEILIEREIRQIKEAGINDITIVVGYMKEKLFYLSEKYNVNIVVNEDYYRYNNTSSLILVTEKLSNTFICSSDNYFVENVFEKYVYESYYSAVYSSGETEEYCLSYNRTGRINKVTIGGTDTWYMLGHVYFSREFSNKFKNILIAEYESSETKNHLWENLYMKHIDELELFIKKYSGDIIKEFDSLEDLRQFDKNYIENTDSEVFKNIRAVLKCKESEISEIYPIKTGLTNVSFSFSCKGKKYVYRHPGVGTEAYINRKSEAASMAIAKELGLDDTFIYIEPTEGWKISYYIENARSLDYHNYSDVAKSMDMIRLLHTSNKKTNYYFDIWKEIKKFEHNIAEVGRNDFMDLAEMHETIKRIHKLVDSDNVPKCLCHCDCYDPNFLIDRKDKMYLIDWEYSGMADPACDIGTFLACSDYNMQEADNIIKCYLQHKPEIYELRHYIGYTAVLSYYWFVWAIYQDSVGKNVGKYLYVWYQYTKSYSKRALELYCSGGQE